MRKGNIIRSIFWGSLALISLSLGIIGLLYNNKIIESEKNDAKRIIEIFNNNSTIKDYKDRQTSITATFDGKNIHVKYTGSESKEYIYKLKNGYLETDIKQNDTIGKVLVMIMTDSIAVNKGYMEKDTYYLFSDNSIYQYKLKDGIEYTLKDDNYNIKINLKKSILQKNNSNITPNEDNLNTDTPLEENE